MRFIGEVGAVWTGAVRDNNFPGLHVDERAKTCVKLASIIRWGGILKGLPRSVVMGGDGIRWWSCGEGGGDLNMEGLKGCDSNRALIATELALLTILIVQTDLSLFGGRISAAVKVKLPIPGLQCTVEIQ